MHAMVNAIYVTIDLGHHVDIDATGPHETAQFILATLFVLWVGVSHHAVVLALEISLGQQVEVTVNILSRLKRLLAQRLKLVVNEQV